MTDQQLENASISWRNDNTPVSSRFDDVYFSADDGKAESHYVFITHNRLQERFASLQKNHFTIAETGFGTGLNFLNTWQLWRQHHKPGHKLYFISAERYPLSRHDLQQSHTLWPEFAPLSQQLQDNYPPALKGLHSIELDDGVTLILLLADAESGFDYLLENSHPQLTADRQRAVDAWFLDGFAPDKNPDMWQPTLFRQLARLSRPGTTFATFTAAGIVKRGLKAAGFAINKVSGFGKKRDMLVGEYCGLPDATDTPKNSRHSRKMIPFWPVCRSQPGVRKVIVIGAGINGCTTADTLAQAGLEVLLLEQNSGVMQEASGNPQAVLFPKLSLGNDAFAEFNLLSLLYAWRHYQNPPFSKAFHACGLLQLCDHKQWQKARQLAERYAGMPGILQLLNAAQASETAQTKLAHNAVFYPQSGWLQTSHLRDYFQHRAGFRFIGNSQVNTLQRTANRWQVSTSEQDYQADAVVLCNAEAANNLLAAENRLPTNTIRGQISYLATPMNKLRTVICHDGYICPATGSNENQLQSFGATFDLDSKETLPSTQSDAQNRANQARFLPEFPPSAAQPVPGRVGFRCCSPDYLPLAGPVPHVPGFIHDYADYRKNARALITQPGAFQPGLFVNIGHGSRGFASAPICAALIRAFICGQPQPLPMSVIQALQPARFIIRSLAQGTP